MLYDEITTVSNSLIQHGPNNDRVYLMKLSDQDDIHDVLNQIQNLAIKKRYAKIFIKVKQSYASDLEMHQFRLEARIPKLYKGQMDGLFYGKYFSASRSYWKPSEVNEIERVIKISSDATKPAKEQLSSDFQIISLGKEHANSLAMLYKGIFNVYPFPVFDPDYIKQTMDDNIQYFGIKHADELVAASSAEIDFEQANAEMTDFATLPTYRGKQFAYHLLQKMIKEMRNQDIQTVYTIARAKSVGMNKTFGKMDFEFGGTLLNNTLIGESIESMNVWYRRLI